MTYSLRLLHDRKMSLRIGIGAGSISSLVEEKLRHVEILLLTGYDGQFGKSHLCNLMSGHTHHLPFTLSYLAHHTVCIVARNIQEGGLSRGLIVGNGALHHMTKIVELMREVFHLLPTLLACPCMRMGGIHCACCVKVSVLFLRRLYNGEYRVHICLCRNSALPTLLSLAVGHGDVQFEIRESLQKIGTALYGLIYICIVERETFHLHITRILTGQLLCSNLEITVTACLLALGKSQRYRHLTGGIQALTPKRAGHNLHLREGYGADGIVLCTDAKHTH